MHGEHKIVDYRNAPPSITLHLNLYEAETLRLMCQAIGGDPDTTRRHVVDELDSTLRALQVPLLDETLISGSVYFKPDKDQEDF